MQLQPSNSIKSCAGTTTAKKQRLGCSTASASTSGPHAVSRATLQSNILATPCPAPSTALQPGRGDMMLISSESRPALPIQSHQRAGTSRLPLKATLSSHTASYPTVWHAVGTGVAKQTLAKPSLFSPPDPIMASQHHSKAAFRPRPSIASTGTSYSSVPASSVFSGRSSRIASVATTASFGSDDAC